MRHLIIAAALPILISGCGAASGIKIESSDLVSIQKGTTAKSDLIRKYGPPTEKSVASDGKETIAWNHTYYKTDVATFIPFVGPFLASGASENTTLRVVIDNSDIVEDYMYSSGASTTKPNGMISLKPGALDN